MNPAAKNKGRPANSAATFWDKVDVRGPDDCWPWKLSLRNGYGNYGMDRKTVYAHRRAYELATGQTAPSGRSLQILHSCNNKACCNPVHLSIGTASKNTQDAYRDGLARGKKGEAHSQARLTQVAARSIFEDTRSYPVIAADHDISIPTVSDIKNGYTWNHITGLENARRR